MSHLVFRAESLRRAVRGTDVDSLQSRDYQMISGFSGIERRGVRAALGPG